MLTANPLVTDPRGDEAASTWFEQQHVTRRCSDPTHEPPAAASNGAQSLSCSVPFPKEEFYAADVMSTSSEEDGAEDDLARMAAAVRKKITRQLQHNVNGTRRRSPGGPAVELQRSAWGLMYEDPIVESEFVVYFLAHRDIMISAAIVLSVVSLLAVFAVYRSNITSNILGFFCAAWALWCGCGVLQFVQRRNADKLGAQLSEPSRVVLSDTTSRGVVSIFSVADPLRGELRKNAFWCEFLAGGTQLGNLMFVLGLSVAKSSCFSGATPQQRYIVCDSAIQLDGGYIILLWINIFLLRMRFHLEAVFVVLTTTLFFLLRLAGGMPEIVPQYLGSFALIGVVESCACVAVAFVRETIERAHYEVYVTRQLKAVEIAMVQRDTERMMASQLPFAVVRSLVQSDQGLSAWGPHTVACVLAVGGFPQWCRKRGPCDAVQLLQRVANTFDSVRELFDTPLEKYHTLGDHYIVMSTSSDHAARGEQSLPHEGVVPLREDGLESRLTQMLRFALLCVAEVDSKLLRKHNASDYSDARNVLLTPNCCVEPNRHVALLNDKPATVSDTLTACCSIDVGYGGGQLLRWTKNVVAVGPVVKAANERLKLLTALSRSFEGASTPNQKLPTSFSIVVSAAVIVRAKLTLMNAASVTPPGWKASLSVKEVALGNDMLKWLRQSVVMMSGSSEDDPLAMLRADAAKTSQGDELAPRVCLLVVPRDEPRESSAAYSCNPLTQSGSTNARMLAVRSASNEEELLDPPSLPNAAELVPPTLFQSMPGEPSGVNSASSEKNMNAFPAHDIGSARLSSALFGRHQSGGSGTLEKRAEPSVRPSIVASTRFGSSGTVSNMLISNAAILADDVEPTWSMDALEWDARQALGSRSADNGHLADVPRTATAARDKVLQQFDTSPIPLVSLPHFVVEDVEVAYQLWSYGPISLNLVYVAFGLQFATSASVVVICCVYNLWEFSARSSLLYSLVGCLFPMAGIVVFTMSHRRRTGGAVSSGTLAPGELRKLLNSISVGGGQLADEGTVLPTENVLKAVFTLLTVLHLISFCAAVFLAPPGNVLSNGQIVWMYMAHGISFSRPRWYGPMGLWLLDVALCAAFTAQALIVPHETPQLKVMNVFLDVANVIYAAVGRLLIERSARESFQTEVEVLLLKEEGAQDYTRLERVLRSMAPEGVAANVIAKVRADADKYLQQKLHPDRSTNFTTTTADVQFIVLELRTGLASSTPLTGGETQSNTAPISPIDDGGSQPIAKSRGSGGAPRPDELLATSNSLRQRLHRSTCLDSSNGSSASTNHHTFVASLKPVMDSNRVIVRLLKHFPHLRLIKSSGDMLLIACEPVKSSMINGVPTDPLGETDADRACEVVQLGTYLVAYFHSLRLKSASSPVVDFRMVLNTGPLVGAVIGRGKGISFEYFGGTVCESIGLLSEIVPWGSVVATERLVLLQEIVKDEEVPVSLAPLRTARDGIWSAQRLASTGVPPGFVVMKRLVFGDAMRCVMSGFAPVVVRFAVNSAEAAEHFVKAQRNTSGVR